MRLYQLSFTFYKEAAKAPKRRRPLFVLEALSREFRELGLPMKLLYADDLVLVAETEELLMEKLHKWNKGMEMKGLRVNIRQRS